MSSLANEMYYEKRFEELFDDFLFQGYSEETAEIKAYAVLSKEEMREV